ncbi:MAG: 3-dehydroquinate synthase [Pseudomonadota bacterium]
MRAAQAPLEIVEAALGERSYPIYIGRGALAHADLLRRHVRGRQVAVVSNDVVAPLYLEKLESALGQHCQLDVFLMADGEQHKSLETYGQLMDFLLEHRHNRSTTVVALGGGVVGDLAGFVAATFQRGVDFLQVPTTLLAQVDSSVGGKTAVNHPRGKNMIGAFHQPRCVLADTAVLDTLPEREYRAGLAEVVKYGVIRDAGFFAWLEANAHALHDRDPDALNRAVRRSCEIKTEVVAADEREGGLRAILNFGHTFGHAIETLTGYRSLLHGEAVAIGMVMAADLSRRQGMLAQADAARLRGLLEVLGLPLASPPLCPADMLRAMGMDKKVQDGRLRLVLAQALGHAVVTDAVDQAALDGALRAATEASDG